jgi:SET domain-containing protein
MPHGAGVFATREIASGERIMTIDGRTQPKPTRYSIQLDHGVHIEASATLPDAEMRMRHPWRFLNHSCDPNARVQDQSLLACRPIHAGEQVTFDYTTTEADMAEPFACVCGTPACVGTVRGFNHLSSADRRARATRLAPHLKSLLTPEPQPKPK